MRKNSGIWMEGRGDEDESFLFLCCCLSFARIHLFQLVSVKLEGLLERETKRKPLGIKHVPNKRRRRSPASHLPLSRLFPKVSSGGALLGSV